MRVIYYYSLVLFDQQDLHMGIECATKVNK